MFEARLVRKNACSALGEHPLPSITTPFAKDNKSLSTAATANTTPAVTVGLDHGPDVRGTHPNPGGQFIDANAVFCIELRHTTSGGEIVLGAMRSQSILPFVVKTCSDCALAQPRESGPPVSENLIDQRNASRQSTNSST